MSRDHKEKSIFIVGCLPSPIGGVSIFCKRLIDCLSSVSEGRIDFYDIYPGKKNFQSSGNVEIHDVGNKSTGKVSALVNLCFSLLKRRPKRTFFNFSKSNSLYYVLLFSFFTRSKQNQLCLHHGVLRSRNVIESLFFRLALRNIETVFALSNEQYNFYQEHCKKSKVVLCSSYIAPVVPHLTSQSSGKDRAIRIIIAGSSVEHYNLVPTLVGINHLATQYKDLDFELTVSIYDEKKSYIKILESSLIHLDNFRCNFTFDLDSDDFNLLLSKHHLYIRNTSIDSFGIIVADAINVGIDALASNVCDRYPGCLVFNYQNNESFIEPLKNYIEDNIETISTSNANFKPFPINQVLEKV